MGFDHLMHDRNRYKKRSPDFVALAKKYPELRKLCTLNAAGRINVDFNDDEVVRTLAVVLLREDFGIKVKIPDGYLVPRIPQRLNYVLVIEDLIRLNGIDGASVIGLDIGTGPICIYPLLALHGNLQWKMYASELDEKACEFAKENVRKNYPGGQIKVFEADADKFFEFVNITNLTFCMCNPPFFDKNELEQKFSVGNDASTFSNYQNQSARSSTIAQISELSSEGGEVQFVGRMIDESVIYRDQIRIYTSLLGKKSSLDELKKRLKSLAVPKYQEFVIGQGRTCRWILAWTFDETIELA